KARKGIKTTAAPKRKGLIIANNNINPDLEEALKLGNKETGVTPEVPDETKGKSTGSSKGAGITPEVPDEPKGKTATHDKTDDDWGSDEEKVILSQDDERTESEKETTKSEKADKETADEDEDVDKHDDADKEMNNADNADEIKEDQEMADAEKVEFKKTKEEKVNDEQAGADQAAKDDQAGALVFVTHKENTKLPPSTSSLSLSSNYGN
nr:hypothetical protein [Tanacetum cinerariifolium]